MHVRDRDIGQADQHDQRIHLEDLPGTDPAANRKESHPPCTGCFGSGLPWW
jgi:hypothetical protein